MCFQYLVLHQSFVVSESYESLSWGIEFQQTLPCKDLTKFMILCMIHNMEGIEDIQNVKIAMNENETEYSLLVSSAMFGVPSGRSAASVHFLKSFILAWTWKWQTSPAQHKFQVYIVLIFAFAAKPPSLLSTITLPPWGELQSATTTVNTPGDGIII